MIVRTSVFVIRDGKILAARKLAGKAAGTITLPGGKLEEGESVVGCGIREVFEETGLDIGIYFVDNINPVINIRETFNGKHYLTLFLLSFNVLGEPVRREPTKHSEWSWYTLKELAKVYNSNWISDLSPLSEHASCWGIL